MSTWRGKVRYLQLSSGILCPYFLTLGVVGAKVPQQYQQCKESYNSIQNGQGGVPRSVEDVASG